jgi:site-specific DNA recombinase
MRLIGGVRISDLTDETTSPERQTGKINGYAELNDHTMVAIAQDLDVSGSVAPFDRPELGPWLKEDRLDQWDALIVARLDRLTRSLFDFLAIWRWLDARHKSLICLEPAIDMTTPAGRAFAQVIVIFAEFELETIRARVKDAYDAARQRGTYPGMQVPFGYMPLKREDKGWIYIPDPEYAPIVIEMTARLLDGQSLNHISRWLNDTGVPTSRNIVRIRNGKPVKHSPWTATTIHKILESPNLIGATVADGKALRDDNGSILCRSEPLIDLATWDRVQDRLRNLAGTHSPRVNSSPLLQVAFCMDCAEREEIWSPLYVTMTKTGGKTYRYYQCAKAHKSNGCFARRVRADELEEVAEMRLLDVAGDVRLTRRTVIPAVDHSEDISRLSERIGHLFGKVTAGRVTGQDVTADDTRLAEAQRQLNELAAIRPVPARVDTQLTSRTFRDRWAEMDWTQRNGFLRENDVRMIVNANPIAVITVESPDRWRDSAAEA